MCSLVEVADRCPRQAVNEWCAADPTWFHHLTFETDGSTDIAAWVSPHELARLDAVPMVELARRWAAHPGRPVQPPATTTPPGQLDAGASATLVVSVVVHDTAGQPLDRDGAARGALSGPLSGAVGHGEPLEDAVRRIVRRKAGVDVRVTALAAVDTEIVAAESGGSRWQVRLTYEAEAIDSPAPGSGRG